MESRSELQQFLRAGSIRVWSEFDLETIESTWESFWRAASSESVNTSVGSVCRLVLMEEDKEAMQLSIDSDAEQNSLTAGFVFGDLELESYSRTKEMMIPPMISANKIIRKNIMAIRVLFLLRVEARLSSWRRLDFEESMSFKLEPPMRYNHRF